MRPRQAVDPLPVRAASSCVPRSAGRGAAATCPSDGATAADLHARHRAPAPSPAPPRRRASAAAPPSASPLAPVPPASAHRGDSSSPARLACAGSARARSRRSSRAASSPGVAGRTRTGRLRRTRGPAPALRARASAPAAALRCGSFASCQSPASSPSPTSIATNRSFLCASMPTYVITFFTTGSLRCGSGAVVALTRDSGGSDHRVECCEALQRYDGEPVYSES